MEKQPEYSRFLIYEGKGERNPAALLNGSASVHPAMNYLSWKPVNGRTAGNRRFFKSAGQKERPPHSEAASPFPVFSHASNGDNLYSPQRLENNKKHDHDSGSYQDCLESIALPLCLRKLLLRFIKFNLHSNGGGFPPVMFL